MQIITIDGPASSGKGTVAKLIAKKLGFHYLESGAIYRVVGLISIQASLNSLDIDKMLALIDKMKLSFGGGRVFVANVDVTDSLRAEEIGMMASLIAKNDVIRKRLLEFQRGFATAPGLVTDGRDMGSVVFPNANLKIFLTAPSQIRANRRYEQLKEYNKNITLDNVLKDIIARDKQDTEREIAPLTYDSSFVLLDNANMSIEDTAKHIISLLNSKHGI